jgi:hypothetical protein
MALSNYTELQAAVADWLNRDDLTTQIPDFIALAEASLGRHPAVTHEELTTLSITGALVALPADCRELLSMYYDETSARGAIEVVSPEELAARKVDFSASGRPRYAAVENNGTYIRFAPEPDQTYTANIEYAATLTALSGTNTTNWLLTGHPDLYLFGTLVQTAPYLKDDPRMAVWQSMLERGLTELDALVRRRRFSPNTPVWRPRRAIG